MRFRTVALMLFVLQASSPMLAAEQAQAPETPQDRFMVAMTHERSQRVGEARQAYAELSARDDTDPWAWIGRSAQALATDVGVAPDPAAIDQAHSDALRALELTAASGQSDPAAPALANYQLGQALTYRRDYAAAAEAFDRTIELMPSFAYAYYYAGMSYREISRVDLMANRFERFLELAPDAPEQVRVQALMQAVRGR